MAPPEDIPPALESPVHSVTGIEKLIGGATSFLNGYGPRFRIPKISWWKAAAAFAVLVLPSALLLLPGGRGKTEPQRTPPAGEKELAMVNESLALLADGKPGEAIALLGDIEEKFGGAPSLDYLTALAALHAGDSATAEKRAGASVEKNERVSDALVLLSMAEASGSAGSAGLRDPKSVREALLRRAVAADPANPFPMLELAGVLRMQGRHGEAVDALKSAKHRLHPVDTHAVVDTTLLLADLQSRPDAELPPAAEEGTLPEMFASVYINLRKGRGDLAARVLEKCRRLSGPDLFDYVMGDPAFASLRGAALPPAAM